MCCASLVHLLPDQIQTARKGRAAGGRVCAVLPGRGSSVPVSDYNRTTWCLNEEAVILREPLVRRNPLPGERSSSSLCLFFSGHERPEGKGRISRSACRISYGELVVKGPIDPVSAREGHMRDACYGNWGDREWQQGEERRVQYTSGSKPEACPR